MDTTDTSEAGDAPQVSGVTQLSIDLLIGSDTVSDRKPPQDWVIMMMMFIGTETLVTQLVYESSGRMHADQT